MKLLIIWWYFIQGFEGKIEYYFSSTNSYDEKIDDSRIIEILTESGIYVMIRNIKIFKKYSHGTLIHIPLDKFYRVINLIKETLQNKVLIHGDVETINSEVVVDTTIMSEKNNFKFIDLFLKKEGIRISFKPPTLLINEWLSDKKNLDLMRKLKQVTDPHNIFNPGKLL